MTMGYTVLWFENNKTYAKGLGIQIDEFITSLGYKPNIIVKPDDSDLEETMEKEEIDLILMDQNLRKGKKGDNLIRKIRRNELYTEAILYSQDNNFRKKIGGQLDGVFLEFRKDLLMKVQKIIKLTLNKSLQLDNIRGLFIAETIYTTSKIEEIVTKILDVSGDTLEFFTCQIMQTGFLSDEAKFEFIQRYLKFWTALANKKIQALETDKEKEPWESLKGDLNEMQGRMKQYSKIIGLRNELAHSKRCQGKRNTLLVKGNHGDLKEKKYDEVRCREIRALFLETSESLKDCLELVTSLEEFSA